MIYEKSEFSPFSNDSERIWANLEQAHQQWIDLRRDLDALPTSLYWVERADTAYLYVKNTSADNGTSLGAKTPDLEARYQHYLASKARLKDRLNALDTVIEERAALYRRLRLPFILDKQAEILRKLDMEALLGTDFLVVGTNAFVAYEVLAGAKFPVGNEPTEDFDLAWCRAKKMRLTQSAVPNNSTTGKSKTLFTVLKSIDASYTISTRKPYQATNRDGYEVELLAAPSTHPLPKEEAFDPMASLVEQEWLLLGRPMQTVVATLRGRACPLAVPDPRWMALHKLWLADKPERNSAKKEKDRRQGNVLLDAVRHFMQNSHPIDVDFVLQLPSELQPVFDAWCSERGFIPSP
jgi:hypothetical protein